MAPGPTTGGPVSAARKGWAVNAATAAAFSYHCRARLPLPCPATTAVPGYHCRARLPLPCPATTASGGSDGEQAPGGPGRPGPTPYPAETPAVALLTGKVGGGAAYRQAGRSDLHHERSRG
ncbi:hypothetical protein Acsp02_60040 [Actinoplanes sp. NBRC 103695]|nr:hypothetical protein Acsp02_60040 [Actinoplanes sp. NBRC 103695]